MTRLGADELRELYERFAPVVHRRALTMLGRDADAWDVVQEVFERMLEVNSFRGESQPMTYIYRATTNVCLNMVRARTHRESRRGDAAPSEPSIEMGDAEAANFLAALARHLSGRELTIATHYFVDELGQDEIATLLGLSRKTIGRELAQVRSRAAALASPPAVRSPR